MKKKSIIKVKNIIRYFSYLTLIFFISCSSEDKNDSSTFESGTPVKIANPIRTDLTENISLNASTIFLKKEIVRSTFQGFIEKIYKNIGDVVNAGDSLFLTRTKESSASDTLQIKIGNRIFKGTITINVQANGVLTELNYNTGDYVSEGEQLAIISNPSSLRINLNVPYQYVLKINRNSICTVLLPNGKIVKANIQKVLPSVDPTSQTQTFILKINNGEILPENLNVSVQIPLRRLKNVLTLPKSAVMSNETLDKFWVMKLINDSTAVRVDIQKGIENDSLVQISKPEFNLIDRIIYDGGYGLADTANVMVTR
jgi:multidrug efflux pump subunit AcrA (membrane-fusion protein)